MPLQLVDTITDIYAKAEEAHNSGRLMQAVEGYYECLKIEPNSVPVLINLGGALKDMGNTAGAIEKFRTAMALAPMEALVLVNLAVTLEEESVLEESLALCESVLLLEHEDKNIRATAQFTIGNCLEKSGQRRAAMSFFTRALETLPSYLRIYNNIGALLVTQGKLFEAEECFSRALIQQPDHVDTHCNRGLVRMATGRILEGMKEFEWRFESPISEIGFMMKSLPIPRWRGERLAGKTIMVHCEQGLGDTIFSARYIQQLQVLGAKVVFRVQRELVRLFSCLESDNVRVVNYWTPPTKADFQISVMSIPTVTEVIDVGSEPYLKPHPALVEMWGQRIYLNGQTPVGIVWHGNPHYKHEKERGMEIEDIAPLFDVQGYKFFSLQKGLASYQTVKYPKVVSLSGEITDMADTAAVLSHMKLLVSMDTSVAHLAGALGRPVKLLVQKFPEWRLHGDKKRSEWYPSTLFYRQEKYKDWSHPVKKIAGELKFGGWHVAHHQ